MLAECRSIAAQALNVQEVSRTLGIPEYEVIAESRRKPPSLMALGLDDGSLIFPGWQFTNSGKLPHLAELIANAEAINRPYTLTRFMLMRTEDLNDLSPQDWLSRGHNPDHVITLVKFMTQT